MNTQGLLACFVLSNKPSFKHRNIHKKARGEKTNQEPTRQRNNREQRRNINKPVVVRGFEG